MALKLEPWLIGSLLLYFLAVNAHPLIVKMMKPGSYAILGILIAWRWKRFAYVASKDIPLLLFAGMSVASVFWTASPAFTSNEFKAALRGTMVGIYLATRYEMKQQMQLWRWVLGIGLVLSLVLPLVLSGYGRNRSDLWIGIYSFKNGAAAIQTLTALLFLNTALNGKKYRRLAWMLFSLALVLLWLTQGKTAYLVFVMSLCLFPLYKFAKQKDKLRVVLMLIMFVLVGSGLVLFISNLEFIVVDTLGKDMNFNGRIPIWQLMLDKLYERPWLGYGCAGFWTSDHGLYVINNSWASGKAGTGEGVVRFNAHNGYMDMLLQYGFVGLSLYLFNILSVLIRLVNLLNSPVITESFWMLQSLMALLLLNFTDNLGMLGQSSLWSFYVSIAFSTAAEQVRLRRSRLAAAMPTS
ncbi:MAG TPA: O-antigen ligase family protein [Cyanobacteria bacterium UBA11149]|nr:O-antigen ligase family protein [Cyanobacteria bacterium UBA11367]HBE60121.1 O-antigen ligase family protein [Cyanobacteria bacterium UBA11366]HBK62698.1 O-antigen ligase family protein [Cyanobacteria bacterium UBA11166]HBR72552.1 O-antigen ligase family protein [Cyanobacteria bacterium UBA11159]HBS71649.1 O-antigen ligase family protein [Cyanobacteria bacterium UBA11153]HBW90163.1 O-antigen ligase family protein [Cyanobacteria bacterium UBA11149]HCA97734.1 O-antigen ligase family protein 